MNYILKKLMHRHVREKLFRERLTEPLHLNLWALFVLLFGSYRKKIDYDLVVRPQHAFGLLKCADQAARLGIKTVSVIEFGVASGAGLLNLAKIAARLSRETGIQFKIYGFDTGQGMPPARDFRDHPDLYQEGDFAMNVAALSQHVPPNVKLIVGNIADSVDQFLRALPADEPLGFVSLDVDYYSSSKSALRVFTGAPAQYLPITLVYLDDIALEPHNSWCGELLAVREFNAEQEWRKIEHHAFLEHTRIFRRPQWIKQVYFLHVLDHPQRASVTVTSAKRFIANPYLEFPGNVENYSVS